MKQLDGLGAIMKPTKNQRNSRILISIIGGNMQILIPDTMLVNGKEVKIQKKAKINPAIIYSNTIPKFIQDTKGIWVKNPKYKGE